MKGYDLMDKKTFEIDADLLESQIVELGSIGYSPDTGLFRPVYSRSWLQARDTLAGWMSDAGLVVHTDSVGNLYGRLQGTSSDRTVLSGSHLDTVRNGGRYDGALGIHGALAALRAIVGSGSVPQASIEVVALCEEEGSRFTSPMLGSQAIVGLLDEAAFTSLTDADGVTTVEAISQSGLPYSTIADSRRTDIQAFVELHIEQGGILESEGCMAGIVSTIVGQTHLLVDVRGKQNHAGTTPMDMRSDALAAAVQMIAAVERIAVEHGRPAVATTGQIDVEPGSRNVIPGRATFSVDVRHSSQSILDELVRAIQAEIAHIAKARSVSATVDELFYRSPTPMNERLVQVIRDIAPAIGVEAKDIVSGAGHDSQVMAGSIPTAMIFTPSRGGISHSPDEFTPISDIVPAVRLLASTLWNLANE